MNNDWPAKGQPFWAAAAFQATLAATARPQRPAKSRLQAEKPAPTVSGHAAAHQRGHFGEHVLADRAHRCGVRVRKSRVESQALRDSHELRGIARVRPLFTPTVRTG